MISGPTCMTSARSTSGIEIWCVGRGQHSKHYALCLREIVWADLEISGLQVCRLGSVIMGFNLDPPPICAGLKGVQSHAVSCNLSLVT